MYELFLGYLCVKMLIVYFLSEISYLGIRLVFVQVGLQFLASKKLVHLSGLFAFKHPIGGGQQQKICTKSSSP